jgi:hypothetical protein
MGKELAVSRRAFGFEGFEHELKKPSGLTGMPLVIFDPPRNLLFQE